MCYKCRNLDIRRSDLHRTSKPSDEQNPATVSTSRLVPSVLRIYLEKQQHLLEMATIVTYKCSHSRLEKHNDHRTPEKAYVQQKLADQFRAPRLGARLDQMYGSSVRRNLDISIITILKISIFLVPCV